MKYNSLNIKLGLCLVHTFTFVTSLLKKACIFCRAKLSNQPNNIGDEHGSFVASSPCSTTDIYIILSGEYQFFFLFIGVAFNSLLSFTSVNLIGSEFTFVWAQFSDIQPCSAAGRTLDIALLLTCYPIYIFKSAIISDLPVKKLS